MDASILAFSPTLWAMCIAVALLAGFVKGVVGFAMPMVMVSLLSTVTDPELALAGLIFPTLVSNGTQALRQGFGAAWTSARRFWVYLSVGGAVLILSAQLVRVLPLPILLGIIGVPVVLFAVLQLAGWTFRLRQQRKDIEAGIGAFAGCLGGISGIWGPPTVLYLTALNTEKTEQMRVQGVIYGLGACALVGAHLSSGVLRAETIPFSAALVLPALVGQYCGGKVCDRIDQAMFKRATLLVLLLVGLNLIRRALVS